MKSTGIVRRVDDLGRVVLPKEVRRSLHLREGDPLEIFVDDKGILLKKYSPMKDLFGGERLCDSIVETLTADSDCPSFICDMDNVLYCSREKGKYLDSPISDIIRDAINERKFTNHSNISIINSGNPLKDIVLVDPIVLEGDLVGALIMVVPMADVNYNNYKWTMDLFIKMIQNHMK